LIAPIALGMWIRHRWEKSAYYMSKVIIPFTFCTLAFIFTVGIYVNLFVFQVQLRANSFSRSMIHFL